MTKEDRSLEEVAERQPGATVTPKGVDVLLSVQGVPVSEGQTEILISPREARRLALRLFELAEEQDRLLEKLRGFKRRLRLLKT
jgi:hypothetical protein